MWAYLKKVYYQNNSARQYQLEFEIAQYMQGASSIQEYYSGFLNLWTDYDEVKYASVSPVVLPEIQKLKELSHRDQILMKLRPEFQHVRSELMSRVPSPSLDECLNELLHEEQRQATQVVLTQQTPTGPIKVAYATRSNYQPRRDHIRPQTGKGKQPGHDMSFIQCYSCKKFSHYASQCK